jgi:hypothetical protein
VTSQITTETHVQIWQCTDNNWNLLQTMRRESEPPIGNEKLTRRELFGDPCHIRNYARATLIEQLVHCNVPHAKTSREYRTELENMSDEELRGTWNFLLGYLME